ncbi:MAG: hypothetical protein V4437_02320 [Patescibacteria group bacterium]
MAHESFKRTKGVLLAGAAWIAALLGTPSGALAQDYRVPRGLQAGLNGYQRDQELRQDQSDAGRAISEVYASANIQFQRINNDAQRAVLRARQTMSGAELNQELQDIEQRREQELYNLDSQVRRDVQRLKERQRDDAARRGGNVIDLLGLLIK